MNNTSIQERLFEFINHLGVSEREFARKTDLASSHITAIKAGTNFRVDVMLKILSAFPQLSIDWLVTGHGHMVKGDEKLKEASPNQQKVVAIQPTIVTVGTTGEENIALIPVKAQAGYIRGIQDPEYFERLPSFRLPKYANGTYRAFEVDGYSMLTEQGIGLHPTDYVITRFVEQLESIKDNKVYVIVNEAPGADDIIVKRCFNTIKSYGWLLCKSDNRSGEYPDIHLDPKFIKEVWEWKGLISAYYPNVSDIYEEINEIKIELSYLRQHLNLKSKDQ